MNKIHNKEGLIKILKLEQIITKNLKVIDRWTLKINSNLVQIKNLQMNKTSTEVHLDHNKIILKISQNHKIT